MPYSTKIYKLTKEQQIDTILRILDPLIQKGDELDKNYKKYVAEQLAINIGGISYKPEGYPLDLVSKEALTLLKSVSDEKGYYHKLITKGKRKGETVKVPVFKKDGKVCHEYGIGNLITYEHVVPANRLCDYLINKGKDVTRADVELVVDNVTTAIVTKAEDKRLNDAKLQSKMPNGWTLGQDKWARYHVVGIEMN